MIARVKPRRPFAPRQRPAGNSVVRRPSWRDPCGGRSGPCCRRRRTPPDRELPIRGCVAGLRRCTRTSRRRGLRTFRHRSPTGTGPRSPIAGVEAVAVVDVRPLDEDVLRSGVRRRAAEVRVGKRAEDAAKAIVGSDRVPGQRLSRMAGRKRLEGSAYRVLDESDEACVFGCHPAFARSLELMVSA